MMVFSTRCSPGGSGAWGRLARLLAVVLTALFPYCAAVAQMDGIEVRRAQVTNSEEGYLLQAEFDIRLSLVLDDALHKGVPLYFVLDFELIRPRWYWTNERLVSLHQPQRLSFNTLTRQYRVGTGSLYQNFSTLRLALEYMSRVRRRLDLAPGELRKDTSYNATLRLRLDTTQLPKPFQLHTGRDWDIHSEAYRWTVSP
jgi:hypothetical protein